MNQKAFTLIKLLVVVLIIGILAAVALPQYEKAVKRSRGAQVFIAARALADAEGRYYLANNEYTNNLANLDIQVQSPIKIGSQNWYMFAGSCNDNQYCAEGYRTNKHGFVVIGGDIGMQSTLVHWLENGQIIETSCGGYKDYEPDVKFCNAYFGEAFDSYYASGTKTNR